MRNLFIAILLIGFAIYTIWYFGFREEGQNKESKKSLEEYYAEGKAYLKQGKVQMAIDLYNEAIKGYPKDAALYGSLAFIYDQIEKNYGLARDYYKKCSELEPNESSWRIAYLGLYIKTNNDKNRAWQYVMSELSKITAEELQKPAIAYNLACLYATNNRVSEALQYLSIAVKDEKLKDNAKYDHDFDNMRSHPTFRSLVY